MARRYSELPFSDVANMPLRSSSESSSGGTSCDTLKSPSVTSRRSLSALQKSPSLSSLHGKSKSNAVPFPTIHEENVEPFSPSNSSFSYDSAAEEARGREWAQEISRRQQSIKELRDRKLRLEQTQAARTRKTNHANHSNHSSYITSPERKLTADDIDFIAALHASVVWRLWHANLTPEVFASERLLATRLHLVLMRHGRKNIPVPPIVALSKPHHNHYYSQQQSFSARHMMERDRPGIQTLSQLVAKSLLLRQRNGKGMKTPPRMRNEVENRRGHCPTSPLARE